MEGKRGKLSTETLSRVSAIKASSRLHLKRNDESSSESEEESDELIISTLRGYCSELRGECDPIDLLQVAHNSCLICLSGVKRTEAVWSCKTCYCLFHLVCIQQWARNGIRVQSTVLSEELFNVSKRWSCPKCRIEYDAGFVPSTYQCFCGKQVFFIRLLIVNGFKSILTVDKSTKQSLVAGPLMWGGMWMWSPI